MKKSKLLPLIVFLFLLGLSSLVFIEANAITTKTTVMADPANNIQVDYSKFNVSVDHTVNILPGGSVAITDTLHLSANENTTVPGYSLGFPYTYKKNLVYVYAFDPNTGQAFNVSVDTGFGNSIGYYGVNVVFPGNGVELRVGSPSFNFTAGFVFSNCIVPSTAQLYNEQADKVETTPILVTNFPTFPSLLQTATQVNVTVITPPNTLYEQSTPFGNVTLPNVTTVGTSQVVSSTNERLPALTYAPGQLNFSEATGTTYQLVTIDNLERNAQVDGQGNIFITDAYAVTNLRQSSVPSMAISTPTGAGNITAFDSEGNTLTLTLANKTTSTYSLSFETALAAGNSTQFTLKYSLPVGNYIEKTANNEFNVSVPVTNGLNSVVGKLSLTTALPEGASIQEYPNLNYSLQNGAFQQEITFTAYNVSLYNNIDFHLSFAYSFFWASFRPTLWMTAIVLVGLAIAMFWRSASPLGSVPSGGPAVKPLSLKALVASYEERTKALLELDSLERQAQKGRLPRRRYKVRKRMVESQISKLDRELVDLKQKAKSMGPRYAEILKDLEIAEADLEGIEAEERRAAARYRAGAYTLDAYRRMQAQYNERREKAKTTIDGALLRLSEGIT